MAADAAAPAARPSRTAETSTSTLWAPDAPLLQGRIASPTLPAPTGMDVQPHNQQSHSSDGVVQPQQEQEQPELSPAQAAEPIVVMPQSAEPTAPVLGVASTSNNAEGSQPTQLPPAAQAQMQHHDANQPWASAWTQPALPALTVAAGRPGLERSRLGQHQHRTETASGTAVPPSLQQPRHSSGRHTARSLSWSQSAQQSVGSLVTSGELLSRTDDTSNNNRRQCSWAAWTHHMLAPPFQGTAQI